MNHNIIDVIIDRVCLVLNEPLTEKDGQMVRSNEVPLDKLSPGVGIGFYCGVQSTIAIIVKSLKDQDAINGELAMFFQALADASHTCFKTESIYQKTSPKALESHLIEECTKGIARVLKAKHGG